MRSGEGVRRGLPLRLQAPGSFALVAIAVYLSGAGTIEASDGELRHLLPGTILLAEDTFGKVTSAGYRRRGCARADPDADGHAQFRFNTEPAAVF